jgi:hypothetical protein
LLHHQKCLCGRSFIENETPIGSGLILQLPANANLNAFVLPFCYCRVLIQMIVSSVVYLMVMGHTVILLPKKFEIHFLSSYSHNGKPVLVGILVLIKMEAFLEVSTLKKQLLLLMMNGLNLLMVMRVKSFLRCFFHLSNLTLRFSIQWIRNSSCILQLIVSAVDLQQSH